MRCSGRAPGERRADERVSPSRRERRFVIDDVGERTRAPAGEVSGMSGAPAMTWRQAWHDPATSSAPRSRARSAATRSMPQRQISQASARRGGLRRGRRNEGPGRGAPADGLPRGEARRRSTRHAALDGGVLDRRDEQCEGAGTRRTRALSGVDSGGARSARWRARGRRSSCWARCAARTRAGARRDRRRPA